MSRLLVGVLGLQGDVEEHLSSSEGALSALELDGEPILVKSAEDARRISVLVIPGGESTAMGELSSIKGILPTLRVRISQGMPTLGTCAGMVMLAKGAEDRAVGRMNQPLLGSLDINVERNSFGRQAESFEASVDLGIPGGENFPGVFIRAPSVKSMEGGVMELGRLGDTIVAVRQGNVVGTSFHPELSGSTLLHEFVIGLAAGSK